MMPLNLLILCAQLEAMGMSELSAVISADYHSRKPFSWERK